MNELETAKELLERVKSLVSQKIEAKNNLRRFLYSFEKRLSYVALTYDNKEYEYKEKGVYKTKWKDSNLFEYSIDEEFDNVNDIDTINVQVKWEEHWRYGGYDAGQFSFPFKYVVDDEEFQKYLDGRNKEIEVFVLEREAEILSRKRKQLEFLKKELGDD